MFKLLFTNYQVIVAISSMVIALLALIVSICQLRSGLKFTKIALTPHLNVDLTATEQEIFIIVKNTGLGPAIIKSVIWKIENISFNEVQLVKELGLFAINSIHEPITWSISTFEGDRILHGEKQCTLKIDCTKIKTKFDIVALKLSEAFSLEIHYESCFNKKYVCKEEFTRYIETFSPQSNTPIESNEMYKRVLNPYS